MLADILGHAHEKALSNVLLLGTDRQRRGLIETPSVPIIGGQDNPAREGLVSFWVKDIPATEVVSTLNTEGVRTHTRKDDYYSANILTPLGLTACIHVSFCHYNTRAEVEYFLGVLENMLARRSPT